MIKNLDLRIYRRYAVTDPIKKHIVDIKLVHGSVLTLVTVKLCAITEGITPLQNGTQPVPVRVLVPTVPKDSEIKARSNRVIFTSKGITIISVLVCFFEFALLLRIRNNIFMLMNAIKPLTTKLK